MSGGHGAEHGGGGGGPGKLWAWWNKGKKRRGEIGDDGVRRVKQIVKSPIQATAGVIKDAKKELWEVLEIEEDPKRGIDAITDGIKNKFKQVVNAIKKPIHAGVDILGWTLTAPVSAVAHSVRYLLKIPGAIPGLSSLLLSVGLIGTNALKYEETDSSVKPAAHAHDHGAAHAADHAEHDASHEADHDEEHKTEHAAHH